MTKVTVINGPNLNLLGVREPEIYGSETLNDINDSLTELSIKNALQLSFFQSNAEHELVDIIHRCMQDGTDYIVINSAAFTHTSVALRDALSAAAIPFVEVHLSNIHAREEFRSNSWLSDIAIGTICGFGSYGYQMALLYIAQKQSPA